MYRRRDEFISEGIHFGQRTDITGITEIIQIFPPGKTRARSRFSCNESVFFFTSQFFTHEWRDQPAQIGSAASASDDDIRFDPYFIKCRVSFLPYNALMQQHLIEYTSEDISISFSSDGDLHSF